MIPIAIYHWNIGIVSRGKGKSAVAAAAYRSGEKLTNEWDGMTHDYTRKGGVVHTEIMLPPHAPPSFSDRSTLWNSVELYEKAGNAQLAREIDAALPIELSREEQIRLVREWAGRPTGKKRPDRDEYNCSRYDLGNQHFDDYCTTHLIRTAVVNELLLEAIKEVCDYAQNNEAEFMAQVCSASEDRQAKAAKAIRQRKQRSEKRTDELSRLIRKLYEDNVNGRLSDKLFEQMLHDFEAELEGLTDSITQDQQELDRICYRGEGERLFVFEAPIDLLSFLCLFKKEWQKQSYLALGGVGEKALLRFLSDRPNIKTVYLCLDSDQAGNDACSRLAELVPEGLTVHRLVPLYKDWNEVLQHRAEITDGKYLREAIYGLKEPPQEETVEIIRMSEVDTQTVEWLWEPYIPFGKVTIVQGNPGEGKTTFALRLAAACTTGGTLPGMKPLPPFQVIYQTAEDGLGDTVKPRLIEADADLDRVLVIDEAKRELTLSDERIEKAITQNGARLIILDPIQAYMGEKTDMNRANEVRPMFRRLADVAERTGCAVILIGHLNKAAGGQSAYRGLGSIDFRAAARSVLLIGRVKREPNVRVIVHDKSSLAPEGKPVAFCLDPETGFSWIGEYDITADELLSGAGGNTATKTEQAERLILDLLADGKELASEDIVKAAAEAGISERTVQNAKRNMGGILGARRVGGQWYNFIKKKQPPEPAS